MPQKVRVALIDDEPSCRDTLRAFLHADHPNIHIIGEAASIAEATDLIIQTSPDLLLLDVHLPDGSGFDILDRFPTPDFGVIFTTAYDDFALRAFRYSAIDYLLKPVDPDLLSEALDKVQTATSPNDRHRQYAQLRNNTATKSFGHITLNTGDGMIFVSTSEIIHLLAHGNYTYVYLPNGEKHLVNRSMKEFDEILPEPDFFRIHQSHLVNTERVRKFLKEDGGYLVMQDGAKLPIARRRKDELLRLLTS